MKFKEKLDPKTVIYQDKIEKLFDIETVETFLELEKTIQDYWNVDRPSANFLNLMIKIKNAKSALEIGTSNGYSSIWIAKALLKTGGKLTTIEYWEKRACLARENFKKTGTDKIITTITGDAIEILRDMKEKDEQRFDFVFVDANKAEYIEYFNSYNPLLIKGGIIIADNILSHYKKTKDFVETIMNNENYQSQILNFDAGMLLAEKIN